MPKRESLYPTAITMFLLVAGANGRSPESDLAAPGAALYEIAVTESVQTLLSKKEQEKGRPPSPGPDYYWCENCKTYHKKGQAPVATPQPAIAQKPGAAPATPQRSVAAAPATNSIPSVHGSYWCEKCKSYHQKSTEPNHTTAAKKTAVQQPVASLPPTQSGDFYYCEQCKTYHTRKRVVQTPATDKNHFPGGVTNKPSWRPLIAP